MVKPCKTSRETFQICIVLM